MRSSLGAPLAAAPTLVQAASASAAALFATNTKSISVIDTDVPIVATLTRRDPGFE